MRHITSVMASILIGVVSAHSADLIPIDVEVGNKGDADRKIQQSQDSASVETISPDWRPWTLILSQKSGNRINPILIGEPMSLDVKTSGDSVYFRLTPNTGILETKWPQSKFHLFVQYGNDYSQFVVEIQPDSLSIQTIRSSWFIEMKKEMQIPDSVVLLLLEGNVPKLKGDAKKLFKELEKIADYMVLAPGYYKDFSEEIRRSKKKRMKAYNYTNSGRLLAFKVSAESRDSFSTVINEYTSTKGIKIERAFW